MTPSRFQRQKDVVGTIARNAWRAGPCMTAPPEAEAIRAWVEKAGNDLRNAEFVLTMSESCPTDTVCFDCRQCAEKYLKALLTLRSVEFAPAARLGRATQFTAARRPRGFAHPGCAAPEPLRGGGAIPRRLGADQRRGGGGGFDDGSKRAYGRAAASSGECAGAGRVTESIRTRPGKPAGPPLRSPVSEQARRAGFERQAKAALGVNHGRVGGQRFA